MNESTEFPLERTLDRAYVVYIQRRLLAGLISDQTAVDALRARCPNLTAERVRALLAQQEDG